jgi:NitT/TauT family transport system substrate-binding protein
MMMKRSGVLLMAAALLSLSLSGCALQIRAPGKGGRPPAAASFKVAVLQGPTALGMLKLMDDNPSLGDGVDASYVVLASPDQATAKLLSGEINVAALPTNLAATLYSKGQALQLAAVSSWGVLYVVSNGAAVASIGDLKGQKINVVGQGTTPDFLLRYLLMNSGIDPDRDVVLDYTLGQVEAAQSLIAGRIKLAVLPEPWVTQAMTGSGSIKVALDLQQEWSRLQSGPLAMTCLVVGKSLSDSRPDAVARFLDEYAASIDWVVKNPGAAGVLAEKHGVGMKAAVAQQAIPRCNLRYEGAAASKGAVDGFLKVLYDFDPRSVGGKLPDESFYYQK